MGERLMKKGTKKQNPLEKLKMIAEKLRVPYDIHEYNGDAKEFCVYEVNNIDPELFADNRAQSYTASARLHYIMPAGGGFFQKSDEIADLLMSAGFTAPRVLIEHQEKRTILQFTTEINL